MLRYTSSTAEGAPEVVEGVDSKVVVHAEVPKYMRRYPEKDILATREGYTTLCGSTLAEYVVPAGTSLKCVVRQMCLMKSPVEAEGYRMCEKCEGHSHFGMNVLNNMELKEWQRSPVVAWNEKVKEDV